MKHLLYNHEERRCHKMIWLDQGSFKTDPLRDKWLLLVRMFLILQSQFWMVVKYVQVLVGSTIRRDVLLNGKELDGIHIKTQTQNYFFDPWPSGFNQSLVKHLHQSRLAMGW